MKSAAGVILVSGLLGIANAQVGQMLRQPGARVVWALETGRLDSSESHAVVTALVVEDSAQPSRRSRGVRINLSTKGAQGEVYLDEGPLEKVKKGLDGITMGIKRARADSAVTTTIGSCEWRGSNLPDPFPVSYIIDWNGGTSMTHLYWSGLVVSPPDLPSFRFPEQSALPLAEAIGRAIDELKTR